MGKAPEVKAESDKFDAPFMAKMQRYLAINDFAIIPSFEWKRWQAVKKIIMGKG